MYSSHIHLNHQKKLLRNFISNLSSHVSILFSVSIHLNTSVDNSFHLLSKKILIDITARQIQLQPILGIYLLLKICDLITTRLFFLETFYCRWVHYQVLYYNFFYSKYHICLIVCHLQSKNILF